MMAELRAECGIVVTEVGDLRLLQRVRGRRRAAVRAGRDPADMIAAGKGEHVGTESGGGPFAMMPSADAIPILVAGTANAAMSMVFRPFGWAPWSGRSVPVAWKGADHL
jgi:hypothetical protein